MARFIANSIRILALIQIICFAISNGQQTFVNIPTATEDYNLNYFIEGNEITLNITGTGKGYIGFGFSNISGMVSADIFIGGVSDSGEPYFGDYSSVSTGTPRKDTQEDWELLSATETDTTTNVVFKRVLDTLDAADIAIKDELMQVIWSVGPSDALTYHGFTRSTLSYNLISQTNGGEEPVPPPTPATTAPPPTTSGLPASPSTSHPAPGFVDLPIPNPLYLAQYMIEEDTLTLAIFAFTQGYVGFGFTNDTGMTNGDVFIGGVNNLDGTVYYGDYTSYTTGVPSKDDKAESDWTLLEGAIVGEATFLKFSRPLVTGDFQDIPVEDKDMAIIWSLGPRDDIGSESYHGPTNRGQINFNLIANAETPRRKN